MGFLWSLLLMCGWMLYGGAHFYMFACNVTMYNGKIIYTKHLSPTDNKFSVQGLWETVVGIGSCNAWIGWVMSNALLHMGWVSVLTVCQTYQVMWLGMTTNERMNRGRYRHFQAKGGKSPFSRGPIKNTADFMECGCFGMVQPMKIDWMTYFDLEKSVEHEPLLRAPTDNYQYV